MRKITIIIIALGMVASVSPKSRAADDQQKLRNARARTPATAAARDGPKDCRKQVDVLSPSRRPPRDFLGVFIEPDAIAVERELSVGGRRQGQSDLGVAHGRSSETHRGVSGET
jgi:hypothetical protein